MYPVCWVSKEQKESYDKLIYQEWIKAKRSKQMELFFDTETTGMIKKDLDVDHKEQAWAIQLAAILSTSEEIVAEMNVIIQPVNNTMNPYALDVHKITLERAKEEGIPELEALIKYADMLLAKPTLIAHNYSFDSQFIKHMFKRNMDKLDDTHRSILFLDHSYFCTMEDAEIKKYIGAKNVKGALKWAKLEEMYEKLFEEKFSDAHDAMKDVKALRACYYELKKREVIK